VKSELLSLGSRTVLSGVVAAAVASALAAACGGSVAPSSFGEGGPTGPDGQAPVCHPDGGIVSSTPINDAGALWTTIYSVDPACCEPQLYSVLGSPNATVAQGCDFAVEMPCSAGNVDAQSACASWCEAVLGGGAVWNCSPDPSDGGAVISSCTNGSGCGFGRPPRGFVPRRVPSRTLLGAKLARIAQLEDASVAAFDAVHADLTRLGAPAVLLRSVTAARSDEVRHARRVQREAARHGAEAPRATVNPIAARSAEALAIDNAEEGCVRETFGAALAAAQAERASDPRLRALWVRIAADELRHAALSWRIGRWLESRLDPAGRARVAQARRRALAALDDELTGALPSNEALGLLGGDGQRRLLAALRATLEAGDLATAA
jgi:hypothetical protein